MAERDPSNPTAQSNFYLTRNNILRWLREEDEKQVLERVLWVDRKNGYAIVIDIFGEKAWPMLKQIAEIESAFITGRAFFTTNDPFADLQVLDSKYLTKHKDKINADWEIIKDAVSREPEIYLSEYRGPIVKIICAKKRSQRIRYISSYANSFSAVSLRML